MIDRVIAVFGPTKCFVTFFADNHSVAGTPVSTEKAAPSFESSLPKSLEGFKVHHKTTYEFAEPYQLTLLDYERV